MTAKPTVLIALKLYTYVLLLGLQEALLNPRQLLESIRTWLVLKRSSYQGAAKDYFWGEWVARRYLRTKKLSLIRPKPSIWPKIQGFLTVDFLKQRRVDRYKGLNQRPRILLIRAGAMGDVLLMTPVVREMFKRHGGFCDITIATRSTELFKNSPYVHNVMDLKTLRKGRHDFDVVIDLDMTIERNRAVHTTDVYAFYALGITSAEVECHFDRQPEIFPDSQDIVHVKSLIKKYSNGYIVCHNRVDPGQPYRNVALPTWQELLRKLVDQFQLPILQIGMPPHDVALDTHPLLIDLRGQISLAQLKVLIDGASLFVGTDAGPLHIAACTQTPIVSFFSIAHHELRRPLRQSSRETFVPITPKIECYGCAQNQLIDWTFSCHRGDSACTSLFDANEALSACSQLIEIRQK